MKTEFIKTYNKAAVIAEDRYRNLYNWHNYNINLYQIDDSGLTFMAEEFNRGYSIGNEYITVGWEELS